MPPRNLYVHFPFCRRKCTYCALFSRAGVSPSDRAAYGAQLAQFLTQDRPSPPAHDLCLPDTLDTLYFGGGSPALCDLMPLFKVLSARRTDDTEFTVELHPLDVSEDLLQRLRQGGVNRISMGVQSLDDATLQRMGRGYTVAEAKQAFDLVRRHFDNAGIDLIVGYPGDPGPLAHAASVPKERDLSTWRLQHCSVYSLILEEKSILAHQIRNAPRHGSPPPRLPSDDEVLDQIARVRDHLAGLGLARYEIANYAVEGRECRHNLAVWRGDDYLGLGAGAAGRVGCFRTQNWGSSPAGAAGRSPLVETVSPERDRLERTLFRLRTREGLETKAYPQWQETLARFVSEGLLTQAGTVFRLTPRGTEVCDTILSELV